MIIRIVKMTFISEKVTDFLEVFNSSKHRIRHFDGCSHLELLNDHNADNVFFTYSYWDSEEALNRYRHSDLFEGVWAKTKVLFAAKAEAWTVVRKTIVD